MIAIDYPSYPFRIREEGGKEYIFDEMRRFWARLTPEEWVRQNFLQYLLNVKKYPASLIAVEKEIMLGELKKRYDILVFDREHRPWLLIECKAMEVSLSESVLEQVLRYHAAVPVPFLVITNGSYCMGYRKEKGQLETLKELPEYPR